MSDKALNILIVDDDEIDVMGIRRALKQLKILNEVTTAIDGIDALNILKGENGKTALPQPALLFLDLNMPRMNGFEFLEALRADPNTADMPVYVLSTSDTDEDIMRSHSFDIKGYIWKADLKESLREALMSRPFSITLTG